MLFFNWYGYRLLTAYWQQRAEQSLQFRLDNNQYEQNALVSIKVPVTALSYYESTDIWERVDGEIIVGGITYRYVKQRVYNDSIELLCLANNTKMQLNQAGNIFFRLANNLTHFPGSKTSSNSDIQKIYTAACLVFYLHKPDNNVKPVYIFLTPALCSGHFRKGERPPIPASFIC